MIKSINIILFVVLLVSCKETPKASTGEDEAAKAAEQAELLRLKTLEEKKAKELALKATLLEAENKRIATERELQLKRDQEAEKVRAAKEKEAQRQAAILKKQKAQELACSKYIGTNYKTLELSGGKILTSVEVTRADAQSVSFMHSNGVATIKYADLPDRIRNECKYDPELAQLAKDKEKSAKKHYMAKKSHKSKKSTPKKAKTYRSSTSNTGNVTKKKPVDKKQVTPRGKITVKIVRVRRGNKDIEIKGIANVNATLHLNDWYWRRYTKKNIKAGIPFTHTWSSVGSKYEVKLVDDNSGVNLDYESNSKKSGLGGSEL